jgi:DNA-binding beta-propeller fold protein YncE
VYVADTGNNTVQVLTPNGNCIIQQFGEEGNGEGELKEPTGVTLDSNDTVYVSDWGNHHISVFTREGNFLDGR